MSASVVEIWFCSLGFEGGVPVFAFPVVKIVTLGQVPNVESQCIGELNCEGQKNRGSYTLKMESLKLCTCVFFCGDFLYFAIGGLLCIVHIKF